MTTPRLLAVPVLVLALCVPTAFSQTAAFSNNIRTINPTFTTIDVPGAEVTGVQSINTAGDMAGVYAPMNRGPAHAFLLTNGVFTYFDYPGAYSTLAYGINDIGLIVGFAYFNGGATAQGFKYNGTTFSLFNDGLNSATFGMGINNAGVIVGGTGSIYETTGFELRGVGYKSITPPGNNIYVYATGINNFGQVIGWTGSSPDSGFAYHNGRYSTIVVPGSFATEAHGLNDSGVIVGWYETLGDCTCAFALKNGAYLSFGYPGALGTFAAGINSAGQVVGSYTFDNTTFHGFVTSPITNGDFR